MKEKIKALFETPKKAACTVAIAAAALAFAGAGTAYAVSANAQNNAIGEDAALNYACADAGIDPTEVTGATMEFDYEAGQFVYEVEFTIDGVEYEYWIAADDGAIVKKESEIVSLAATEADAVEVTLEEARAIALEDAGVTEDEVTFTKAQEDTEDGEAVFEFDFQTEDTEFEYEVRAADGTIVNRSKEAIAAAEADEAANADEATTTTGGAVTLAEAKELALANAGLTADEVTFTKAEVDYDDGVKEYDIEFYTDAAEYEYEVRASDGTILGKDVEQFQATGDDTGTYITLDEAKNIALDKAGLKASQVTFTKAMLDKDDGVTVYEVEFYKGTVEYEVEINASTGAILDYDVDYD